MGKRVQMPDGKIAEFPDSMSPEQIESYLRSSQPTQFEIDRDPNNQPGFWSHAGQALKRQIKPVGDLLSAATDPYSIVINPDVRDTLVHQLEFATDPVGTMARGAYHTYTDPRRANRSPIYKAAAAAVSPILDPSGMEQA